MGILDTLTRYLTLQGAARPAPPAAKSLLLDDGWTRAPWDGTAVTYGTRLDYATEAGDLGTNGIIMACIGWLMRAEPEAPWVVSRRTPTGVIRPPAHPLLDLLLRPNPYYSGLALRQATVFSYNLDGNAYWIKVRNNLGRVIRLMYEPHMTIHAVGSPDDPDLITKYQVLRKGQWYDIARDDVVHFRDGINPANPRYGQRRLESIFREVATDNEAARYTYTLLKNLGISPVVISPADPNVTWTPEEAAALKAGYIRNTTGDSRGSVVVNISSVKVDRLSFPPDEMDAGGIRMIPESRIAAALNMPAGIAGLLVGLEHNTYSNMGDAYRMAIMSNLAPYWRVIADTVTNELIPDFGDTATEYVSHDTTQVKVLQEDQTAIYTRMNIGYQGGWVKRSEARQATNWPVATDGSDDVYRSEPTAPMAVPGKAVVSTNGVPHA